MTDELKKTDAHLVIKEPVWHTCFQNYFKQDNEIVDSVLCKDLISKFLSNRIRVTEVEKYCCHP